MIGGAAKDDVQHLRLTGDEPDGWVRDSRPGARRFFNGQRMFDHLENAVIPEILSRKTSRDGVRAWIVDCATGEDAYAVAMLLCEVTDRMGAFAGVQVFATEPDGAALAVARAGRYPEAIARDISPERLARWFVREGDQYCVRKELREKCIFSTQDVTKDMPFSRMDIVSARRTLTNLEDHLRDSVIHLFNFSLRPGGCLIASPAAAVGHHPDLFRPVPDAPGLFRRVDGPKRILPVLPLTSVPGARRSVVVGTVRRPTAHVDSVESELRLTREELRCAIERLEIANRDLQRTSDGFRTVNQELELSKEELNSANKELETVNSELNYRICELAKTNSDLRNFLNSSQVATIFLDRDLRIMKFTVAAADALGLISSDLGCPIDQVASDLLYEELRQDVGDVLRTLGTLERQLQSARTGSRYLLRIMPYRSMDNAIAGVVLTFLDITAAFRAEDALRRSEERFQMMAGIVPATLFTADADLAWDYVNPPFYESTGLPDGTALGEGWLAAVHAEDLEAVRHRLADCRQSGESFEHEFRMRDASIGYRWYLARATAMRNPAGEVVKWAGSLVDIHERRTAEARQRLLFAELQHRVKNVLAVVRSIVGHTVETSSSLEDFASHFDGRLNALARTQASLARHGGDGVDLEELIAEELLSHAPADDKQVKISGPSVRLQERAAEALGLAIHELATNAVKYGAFANPSGSVSVSWNLRHVDSGRRLHLEWVEHTVPVIDPNPKRVGFGREFLERGLPFELDADTALEFRPGGLRFVLDAALGGARAGNLQGRHAT